MVKLPFSKDLVLFYPCTKKEYDSGDLYSSLLKLCKSQPSKINSFDLFLFFDLEFDIDSNFISEFEKNIFINKIHVHFFNFSDQDNLYIQPWSPQNDYTSIPRHGLSSGPNNSFYQSLYHLIDITDSYGNIFYKNFFLIETDIQILKTNWFNFLVEYCDDNSFLIAGSKYKGLNHWHNTLDYKDHLNGIALYKNCKDLLTLLRESESHLIKSISEDKPFMNFDIAIDEWRRSPEGQSFFLKSPPLIDTNFITNASDPQDQNLTKNKILKFYPETIFLHHKTSSENSSFSLTSKASTSKNYLKIESLISDLVNTYNKEYFIPTFFHIPKNAGTYVGGILSNLLRFQTRISNESKNFNHLNLSSAFNLHVYNGNDLVFNFYLLDTDNNLKFQKRMYKLSYEEGITYKVDVKNLKPSFFHNFFISSMVVMDKGFPQLEVLKQIINISNFAIFPFLILREPLSRQISLFEYNTGSDSTHESNHGNINGRNFSQYINSIQLEDSWLIRSIMQLKDSEEIDDDVYKTFLDILKNFKVIILGENLFHELKEFFLNSFNMDLENIPFDWLKDINGNHSSKKYSFDPSSLNAKDVETFKSRSFYEYKLYNHYK